MDTVPVGNAASLKPRLITAAEVAERLALTESGVYEMARQNRIGGIVRVGRRVRFDPEKLETWIEAGGQALPGGWRQEQK